MSFEVSASLKHTHAELTNKFHEFYAQDKAKLFIIIEKTVINFFAKHKIKLTEQPSTNTPPWTYVGSLLSSTIEILIPSPSDIFLGTITVIDITVNTIVAKKYKISVFFKESFFIQPSISNNTSEQELEKNIERLNNAINNYKPPTYNFELSSSSLPQKLLFDDLNGALEDIFMSC